MPDVADIPLALGSQAIREDRRKPFFPIPHGLVGEFKAPYPKEFRHISVTHLVAESTQQDLEDDIGRHFDEVKRSAGAFIEGALTVLAAENGVAQVSRTSGRIHAETYGFEMQD